MSKGNCCGVGTAVPVRLSELETAGDDGGGGGHKCTGLTVGRFACKQYIIINHLLVLQGLGRVATDLCSPTQWHLSLPYAGPIMSD